MRYEVIVLETAEYDIYRIGSYIRETFCDPITAKRMVDNIYKKIISLSITPARNRIENDYYAAAVKNYRIIYRIVGQRVYVMRVKHVRQLMSKVV